MNTTSKNIQRLAVLTSGGDAPGMNACIRSVVRTAHARQIETIGVMQGYEGLLQRNFHPLQVRSVANTIQRGGTILMSSRCEAFLMPEQRAAAYLNLKREKIDALIAIGGDGTLKGLRDFAAEHQLPVCGIPATIDNDLLGTDFSLGFDTALNTAVDMVDKLRDTAAAYNRVMLVEVMGRDSGQIATHVALACGAEAVAVPERPLDIAALIDTLNKSHERGKLSQIIIVAEGAHKGGVVDLAEQLQGKIKAHVRYCVLGHVQRGGNPTARDRLLAGRLGRAAVDVLLAGQTAVMVGEVHEKIAATPLTECLAKAKALDLDHLELLSILAT